MSDETALVFFHGLTQDEAVKAMRAVKAALPERDTAFAMANDNNRQWKVADLIEEVTEEHRQLKENPPQ